MPNSGPSHPPFPTNASTPIAEPIIGAEHMKAVDILEAVRPKENWDLLTKGEQFVVSGFVKSGTLLNKIIILLCWMRSPSSYASVVCIYT